MPATMTERSRKLMTAWLGLVAMWLIVFAPLVSQGLASHDAYPPAVCSAHEAHDAEAHRHVLADHLSACGYCNLLAHQALAPASALPQWRSAARYRFAEPLPRYPFASRKAFPAARPRDSPSLV
jgi:Protein of unknown function (DUF2946)